MHVRSKESNRGKLQLDPETTQSEKVRCFAKSSKSDAAQDHHEHREEMLNLSLTCIVLCVHTDSNATCPLFGCLAPLNMLSSLYML
jgi:hypothetical protein